MQFAGLLLVKDVGEYSGPVLLQLLLQALERRTVTGGQPTSGVAVMHSAISLAVHVLGDHDPDCRVCGAVMGFLAVAFN